MGFDDNMVGLSAGSQNVCMLAAFGNGGVVPQNCVPIIGTQAESWSEQWSVVVGSKVKGQGRCTRFNPAELYIYICIELDV